MVRAASKPAGALPMGGDLAVGDVQVLDGVDAGRRVDQAPVLDM
jgi:hypothetical protein